MAQTAARQGIAMGRKLVFALLLFATTFTAVTQLRPLVMSQRPLPGDAGVQGPCAVWFVGSSTVARWSTMERDMAPWRVENRGVGGALIPELAHRVEVERVVDRPGTLVIYVGDNDLADGRTSEEAAEQLFGLIAAIRARMPDTQLVLLGIKPSPARWDLRRSQLHFDRLVRDRFGAMPRISFADVGPSLLVRDAPGPFYVEDGIHLNEAGYRAWGGAVRRAVETAVPPDQAKRCTGRGVSRA